MTDLCFCGKQIWKYAHTGDPRYLFGVQLVSRRSSPAHRAPCTCSARAVALAANTNLTRWHRSRLMTKSIQITLVWEQGEKESSEMGLNKKKRMFGYRCVSGCLVCPLLCSHARKQPLLSFNKSRKKISEEGSQPWLHVVGLFHQIVGQDKTEFATTVQKMLQWTGVALQPGQIRGEALMSCRCFADVFPIN